MAFLRQVSHATVEEIEAVFEEFAFSDHFLFFVESTRVHGREGLAVSSEFYDFARLAAQISRKVLDFLDLVHYLLDAREVLDLLVLPDPFQIVNIKLAFDHFPLELLLNLQTQDDQINRHFIANVEQVLEPQEK